MIFLDRGKKGQDHHLDWRVRFFFIGALLALIGIWLESRLLVGLAIGVLVLGMGLRFLPGRNDQGDMGDGDQTEDSHEKEDSAPPPSDRFPSQP